MKNSSYLSQWRAIALCGLIGLGIIITSEQLVHAERYNLTDLGDLAGGKSKSYGHGLNNLGQVVGVDGQNRPFIYHGNLMMLQGFESGKGQGIAHDINRYGDVVGYVSTYTNTFFSHAALYNRVGIPLLTKTLKFPSAPDGQSEAYGINDFGQVVGYASTKDRGYSHAFLYHNGVVYDLGTLLSPKISSSTALAINNSGQVVGSSQFSETSIKRHAFLYSNDKMVDLRSPNPLLDKLDQSKAQGINKYGHVVGWYMLARENPRAFIYKNGSMQDLNTLLDVTGVGWYLREATAINDNGQILANAHDKNGRSHAVLLTPVPTP